MKTINLLFMMMAFFCCHCNLNAQMPGATKDNPERIEGKTGAGQVMEAGMEIVEKHYPGKMFVPGGLEYDQGRLIMRASVANRDGTYLKPELYIDVTGCPFLVENRSISESPVLMPGVKTWRDVETVAADFVAQFFPGYKKTNGLLFYDGNKFILEVTVADGEQEKKVFLDATNYIDEYKKNHQVEPDEAIQARIYSEGKFPGYPVSLSGVITETEVEERISSYLKEKYAGYKCPSVGDMTGVSPIKFVRFCFLESENGEKKAVYFDITDYMEEYGKSKSSKEKRKSRRERSQRR